MEGDEAEGEGEAAGKGGKRGLRCLIIVPVHELASQMQRFHFVADFLKCHLSASASSVLLCAILSVA